MLKKATTNKRTRIKIITSFHGEITHRELYLLPGDGDNIFKRQTPTLLLFYTVATIE
jgi:hypothetical protein